MKHLRIDRRQADLNYFAQHRQVDRTNKHQVWQPLQAKNVYTPAFLIQKMEYIHNNPIAKHSALVANRADFSYSSARFYDRDEAPLLEMDDVRAWLV